MRVVHRALVVAMAGLGVAGLSACGAGDAASVPAMPARDLPPYVGHAAQLFDDAIEPLAVGEQVDPGVPPASDTRVRERTQTGDAVVRARAVTVTAKKEGPDRQWQLSLHTLERMAGSGPVPQDFTIDVEPTDPAAGIVRAYDVQLVGMKFVAFVRAFARKDSPGDSDLHFHIAPDSADEISAVKAAVLLQEVR